MPKYADLTAEQRHMRHLALVIAGHYAEGGYDETAARWVNIALAEGDEGGKELNANG